MFNFSVFDRKYFGPKNQTCLFKMQLGAKSNLDLLNSIVMFTFSGTKNTSFDEIYSKKSNQTKMKHGVWTN